MIATLVSGSLKTIRWGLAATGLVALILAGLVGWPLEHPPELTSISDARKSVDFSGLPDLERFQGRDGTALAYRHYPARGVPTDQIAVVVHGSSGSSGTTIHALSSALALRGVQTYAVDIRGHGASGTRGDIGYTGQLEDDLAELVAVVRQANPTAPLTLIGHSSGGGFALRVAGSNIQNLFARTVLLAPYLGYDAPTTRPGTGGWANADVPRIVGLILLRKLGINCCDAFPVVAFAVPPHSEGRLVASYTERLRSNFGTHQDFRTDLAAASRPITVFSGTDDELMVADKYDPAVRSVVPSAVVRLVNGINHMGIVSDPAAVSVIVEDVARAGAGT
jgi:pimeloyl-ACP methyl ester carboxylesterase